MINKGRGLNNMEITNTFNKGDRVYSGLAFGTVTGFKEAKSGQTGESLNYNYMLVKWYGVWAKVMKEQVFQDCSELITEEEYTDLVKADRYSQEENVNEIKKD